MGSRPSPGNGSLKKLMVGLADTMLYSSNWQLKILSGLAFPLYTVKQETKPNNPNNPSISNYLVVLLKVSLFK